VVSEGGAPITDFIIRAARALDAGTIAELNLACWRETYAGLVPAETMAALTLEERIAYWRAVLDVSAEIRPSVSLALNADGEAIGFSSWRPHALALRGLGRGADISAIYLLKRAQRRGAGRALMRRMAEEMRENGANWTTLLVLRDNLPARRFYESLGGRRFGRETLWRGVTQVAYGWRDVARLAARTETEP
jgi:ribosomal protein S18 acetylase RimI-like enzyme